MKRWFVILSTVTFGKTVEVITDTVFGDTEEQAMRQAEACGFTTITGWKFERLEAAA